VLFGSRGMYQGMVDGMEDNDNNNGDYCKPSVWSET